MSTRTLLDAGGGFGGTLACLNEGYSNLNLLGINIDAQQLQRAATLVQPRSENSMLLLLADTASLPVADESVDEILAVESIFHFDRNKFLSESSRLLRRGGGITLSDFIPQERRPPYSVRQRQVSLLGNAQLLAGSWRLQTLGQMHLRFTELADNLFCCISLAWHSMLSFIASKTLILYQCMDLVKGARSQREPFGKVSVHKSDKHFAHC